jgi:WhiB family redox-sensing transcriptional regulator
MDAIVAGQPRDVGDLSASLSELLGIDLQATEWMRDGLCAQTDPDAFHPASGESLLPAQSVCRVCRVQTECLVYALEHNEQHGVWGGTSARQRQAMLRRSNEVAA